MQLLITPKAVQKVRQIMTEKGGGLALRIAIRPGLTGPSWKMSLEAAGPEAIAVCGVPVQADHATRAKLEGMVIDWVVTPEGPGFGVYNSTLAGGNTELAAD